MTQIDGRQEDLVITHSGARLGRLDHIFKDMTRVREAQIVQSRQGHMVLKIVKGTGYTSEDECRLKKETLERVGNEVDFQIEYVRSLPRSKSGKLRFVVSTLPSGKLVPVRSVA